MLALNHAGIWNRVADIIEQEPERYGFAAVFVPYSREPACLWGLAGYVLGMHGAHIGNVVNVMYTREQLKALADGDYCSSDNAALYRAMDRVCPSSEKLYWVTWRKDPKQAVAGLRKLFPLEVMA